MDSCINSLQQTRDFFTAGNTFTLQFRKEQLNKLKEALYKYEHSIYDALYADLKKNPEECWVTEIGFTISEINYALKNLKKWMHPKRVRTNLLNFPSSSFVVSEPLGVSLIISPWNYPLQLLLVPLVGAIAAGNCAVLKPSEFAAATSALLRKIIADTFDSNYIHLVQGDGSEVIPQMMSNFRFDHVFYTGSTAVGKMIYQMAAKSLTPVTLELGGKSPCIVEKDVNIKVAARRIAMTKFSNTGQMCVAPDYLLVHQSRRDELIEELKSCIESLYAGDSVRDYHYGKVVNEQHLDRLIDYMQTGQIVYGGGYDRSKLFLQPTLITDVDLHSPVMKEEIFGPVLPVLSWQDDEDVYAIIKQNSNPLALYVFTNDNDKAKKWTRSIAFGGGCINNAGWHLTNHHLPFGGRGNSGIGNYHGKFSFQTFSHQKAIMKTPTWFDPSLKYTPFKGKLALFKKVIR